MRPSAGPLLVFLAFPGGVGACWPAGVGPGPVRVSVPGAGGVGPSVPPPVRISSAGLLLPVFPGAGAGQGSGRPDLFRRSAICPASAGFLWFAWFGRRWQGRAVLVRLN